jgi:hypothetical protein
MLTLDQQIDTTLVFIKSKIPKFEIVDKEKSFFMKVLKTVLFFMPFMKYVTTIGWKVYLSGGLERLRAASDESKRHFISVILHEFTHMRRCQRLGFIYNLIYLTPQIFALGAIFVFLSPLFLLFLLFLAPIPSPGRAWIEFEGYCTSAAVYGWLGMGVPLDYLTRQFTSSAYYFMWPFRTSVERWFLRFVGDISNGIMSNDLREIKEMMFKW